MVKTLADIAGGTTPQDWNGTPLASLPDNAKHDWTDFAVSKYYAHNIASGYLMVRAGKWKYTYHAPVREL